MGKRTRQSNSREYCPVCMKLLSNRASASSHYRAHVRKGELESRGGEGEYGMEYSLPGTFMGVWWRMGMSYHKKPITADDSQLRNVIDSWLRELWHKQPRNRKSPADRAEAVTGGSVGTGISEIMEDSK